MDYDDVANVSLNQTFEDIQIPSLLITHELLFALITIVGGIADAFIIYVILRFKNMQTKRNVLILNWAGADFMFQLLNPAKFRFLYYAFDITFYLNVYCILHNSEMLYMAMAVIIVLMLSLNFIYRRLTLQNLKIIMPVFWIIFAGFHILSIGLCAHHLSITQDLNILLLFLIFIVAFSSHFVKIIVYSLRRIKRQEKNTKLRYILTSAFSLCWFASALLFLFNILTDLSVGFRYFVSVAVMILCCTNPILNIFLLCKYDKNFWICFLHILKCQPAAYVTATVSYEQNSEMNVNVIQTVPNVNSVD